MKKEFTKDIAMLDHTIDELDRLSSPDTLPNGDDIAIEFACKILRKVKEF